MHGINLYCTQRGKDSWQLTATTENIGLAEELPLLIYSYSLSGSLSQKYRYHHPPEYANPELLARFNQELEKMSPL